MARYGNSGGRNRGKKYVKLRGDETATPESEARARDFMEWYGQHVDQLRYYVRGGGTPLDEDTFSETLLRVYDAIAYKGADIRNYVAYFLLTYRTTLVAAQKRAGEDRAKHIYYDRADTPRTVEAEVSELADPGFNSHLYEELITTLDGEILDYVRSHYDEVAVSLFEMYIGLAPDISYKRLAALLGIPGAKIWPVIGQIKKEIAAKFRDRRNYLMSLL